MNERDKRIQLAQQVAPFYESNEKVSVVMIAGSVARGTADAHSDIEINVLWKEEPTDDDRKGAIASAGGEIEVFHAFEADEWSEVFRLEGIKFEMSHFLQQTVENCARDLQDGSDTDWDKQILLASTHAAIPLYGEEVLAALRQAAAYPDALGEAMIEQHLEFREAWYYAPLAERGDLVMLHDVYNKMMFRLFSVLHGLNRQYISHPRFKWAEQTLGKMELVPADMHARIQRLYRAEPADGMRELQWLADDVIQLVKEAKPHLVTQG